MYFNDVACLISWSRHLGHKSESVSQVRNKASLNISKSEEVKKYWIVLITHCCHRHHFQHQQVINEQAQTHGALPAHYQTAGRQRTPLANKHARCFLRGWWR